MYANGGRRSGLGDAEGRTAEPIRRTPFALQRLDALAQVCGVGACQATMRLGEEGLINVDMRETRNGDAGVEDTVAAMSELIRAGSVDPIVRGQAIAIVKRVAVRDYDAQVQAIRKWVSDHTVFLRDPTAAELLHAADLMVRSIHENADTKIHVDCDDVAILSGALGMSVGLLCQIHVVSFITSKPPARFFGLVDTPAPYEHVWAELSTPVGLPRWADMDTTRQSQGVDPSLIERSLIVPV